MLGICIKKKRVQRFRTSDRDSLDLSRITAIALCEANLNALFVLGVFIKRPFFGLLYYRP